VFAVVRCVVVVKKKTTATPRRHDGHGACADALFKEGRDAVGCVAKKEEVTTRDHRVP
jgi:hypothetical protein